MLLVELDLVSPSFNRLLGFEKVRGMADYLLHDAPLSEIVMNIGVDGLAIIPAGSPVANSFELLSSRKMARFVGELKQLNDHEVVLFDLPSVLAFDDAVAFSPLVDCALLVVEEGSTKVSDVRRALTRLEHTKIFSALFSIAQSEATTKSERPHAKSAAFWPRASSGRLKDRFEVLNLIKRIYQFACGDMLLNAF